MTEFKMNVIPVETFESIMRVVESTIVTNGPLTKELIDFIYAENNHADAICVRYRTPSPRQRIPEYIQSTVSKIIVDHSLRFLSEHGYEQTTFRVYAGRFLSEVYVSYDAVDMLLGKHVTTMLENTSKLYDVYNIVSKHIGWLYQTQLFFNSINGAILDLLKNMSVYPRSILDQVITTTCFTDREALILNRG